jgi:hypothetical protein
MVHKDMAHGCGCQAEKMSPIPQCLMGTARQSQISFMEQSRGLQSMTRPLLPHLAMGHAAQLGVDNRHQPF